MKKLNSYLTVTVVFISSLSSLFLSAFWRASAFCVSSFLSAPLLLSLCVLSFLLSSFSRGPSDAPNSLLLWWSHLQVDHRHFHPLFHYYFLLDHLLIHPTGHLKSDFTILYIIIFNNRKHPIIIQGGDFGKIPRVCRPTADFPKVPDFPRISEFSGRFFRNARFPRIFRFLNCPAELQSDPKIPRFSRFCRSEIATLLGT